MANENHRVVVSFSIFVLMAVIMPMLRHGSCVEAAKHKHLGMKPPKGTVKTIKSDDGDVIDCVDFYKQPAFDNPLIKDLQMEPSSYPNGMNTKIEDFPPELFQDWRKNGECPEGTIPILRIPTRRRSAPSHLVGRQLNHSFVGPNAVVRHEYAIVKQTGGPYRGGFGSFSIWNPYVEVPGFSLTQIWVAQKRDPSNLNTLEAGWIVYPELYRDTKTRFFIYWTRDSYQHTGCYDLRCEGFVHTNTLFAIGGALDPVSVYNGPYSDIEIAILKDSDSGHWLLKIHGFIVGFWPDSIVPGLANGADNVHWGGEIFDSRTDRHTATHMGSGLFALAGFERAAFAHDIGVIDSSNNQQSAIITEHSITKPNCYDLIYEENLGTAYGTKFFYGGPGHSELCP